MESNVVVNQEVKAGESGNLEHALRVFPGDGADRIKFYRVLRDMERAGADRAEIIARIGAEIAELERQIHVSASQKGA
jgi:hypothetical protein